MLVLSRRMNETIVIDGQIEIEVLKIKGNTVRLGIKAPRNIKVLRGELSPFEVDLRTNETPISQPIPIPIDLEDLTRLPNPFAVAHAS
ncbi:MAG: carbon storage regulator [Mariniblastus sp.]|jgi:carbon storage regulator